MKTVTLENNNLYVVIFKGVYVSKILTYLFDCLAQYFSGLGTIFLLVVVNVTPWMNQKSH